MTYSLSLSNGNPVPRLGTTGLQDGTVNSSSTSLSLVGKNYPGYGKLLNENFIHLLENFASNTSPEAALPGQIWWDSGSRVLKVNTVGAAGTAAVWKSLSAIIATNPVTDASTSATLGTPKDIPYLPVLGDLWWDTVNRQLKLFSALPSEGAAGWITIGPANDAKTGQTGATPDTVIDAFNISHTVVKFYVGGGDPVAILSKDEDFVPNPPIPGFSTVKSGFNLSTVLTNLPEYHGTAEVARKLLVNGVAVDASVFSRTDVATVADVGLITSSTDGITLGPDGNFVANVDAASGNSAIYQTVSNTDLMFYVTQGNTKVPVMKAVGTLGAVEVFNNPTTVNGVANKRYVDTQIAQKIAEAVPANTVLLRDGSTTITGTLIPSANVSIDLGSTTAWFRNIYGTSVQAKYADVAERYAADAEYSAGTVVELGGTHEITAVKQELSEAVFGVVSHNAAYLMNAEAGNNVTHPPVAMTGRVPVRVTGVVKRGDRLVSAGHGLARAGRRDELTPWNVIGRALESKDTPGIALIEATVAANK